MIPTPFLSYANNSNNESIIPKSDVSKNQLEQPSQNMVQDNITELKEILNFYKTNRNFYEIFKFGSYALFSLLLFFFSISIFYRHQEITELYDISRKVVEQENNRRNFLNQNFRGE